MYGRIVPSDADHGILGVSQGRRSNGSNILGGDMTTRYRIVHGDCVEAMREAADRGNLVDAIGALEVGKAAEHLVCADLILQGHRAYLSDQGLPYDVVVDVDGRLLRVQVKATACPKIVPKRICPPKYQWNVRRAGKGAKRIIGNDEFEILALVALDIRTIAYIPINDKVLQTVHLRQSGIKNKIQRKIANVNGCIDEYPFADAIKELSGG